MSVFNFSEFEILLFFAALVRVSVLFMLLPIFGDNNIPGTVKILFPFALTLMLFPVLKAGVPAVHPSDMQSNIGIILVVAKEAAVGLIMGFVAKMFFDALSFGFAFVGMQMGFTMASMYDHHSEANMPVISQVIMIFATLLFLGLDGHHMLIRAMVESFRLVPIGGLIFSKVIGGFVMDAAVQIFWIAVKLSAPMALVIFLANTAFGIIAKAVPQINVLVVSFSVNILVGFFVLFLTLPVFGTNVGAVFQEMFVKMTDVLHYLT